MKSIAYLGLLFSAGILFVLPSGPVHAQWYDGYPSGDSSYWGFQSDAYYGDVYGGHSAEPYYVTDGYGYSQSYVAYDPYPYQPVYYQQYRPSYVQPQYHYYYPQPYGGQRTYPAGGVPTGDSVWGNQMCDYPGYGRTFCGFDPRQRIYDPWTGTWY